VNAEQALFILGRARSILETFEYNADAEDIEKVRSFFAALAEHEAELAGAVAELHGELTLLVSAIEGHSSAQAGPATDDPYIEARICFARAAIAKATPKEPQA
jgi:hypothetical protein